MTFLTTTHPHRSQCAARVGAAPVALASGGRFGNQSLAPVRRAHVELVHEDVPSVGLVEDEKSLHLLVLGQENAVQSRGLGAPSQV